MFRRYATLGGELCSEELYIILTIRQAIRRYLSKNLEKSKYVGIFGYYAYLHVKRSAKGKFFVQGSNFEARCLSF